MSNEVKERDPKARKKTAHPPHKEWYVVLQLTRGGIYYKGQALDAPAKFDSLPFTWPSYDLAETAAQKYLAGHNRLGYAKARIASIEPLTR